MKNINISKMVNYNPTHYRIKFGNIRIIFMFIDGVVTIVDVKDIDYRGNIYKK